MSMELIQTIPVGSGGQASITFSSIEADWTDLYLVVSGKSTRTNAPRDAIKLQFNGVTSGYSSVYLEATGSATDGLKFSSQSQILFEHALSTNFSGLGNLFGSASIYISDYLSSQNKSVSSDQTAIRNSTDAHSAIEASLSTVTSPITSIYLSPQHGDFTQYSTASLYGIASGSDGTTTVA